MSNAKRKPAGKKRGPKLVDGEPRKPMLVMLTDTDRKKVRAIQEHEGQNSQSEAVRFAIRRTHDELT